VVEGRGDRGAGPPGTAGGRRCSGQPLRLRPGAPLGGRRRPAREQGPQHALRRSHAHRQGAAHDPARRGRRARRGGPAMTADVLRSDGVLVLDDGTLFEGDVYRRADRAAAPPATGEIVFNTSLSGYQEIITDPSYAG